MPEKIIVDLRLALREFVSSLGVDDIPDYVLIEVVHLVFDVLIFELEDIHEEPDLARLGNYYRDHIEPDPLYMQRFLGSFYLLVKDIASQLKSHEFYTGSGFEYGPDENTSIHRIVVRRFEHDTGD